MDEVPNGRGLPAMKGLTLIGSRLHVNADNGGDRWSMTGAPTGYLIVGPEGLPLPPGTLIRATGGGEWQILGPGTDEALAAVAGHG